VEITFAAAPTMTTGIYLASLRIATSDAVNPQVTIPVTMTVVSAPTCSFATSSPDNVGQTTFFTNTTTGDAPLTYQWDFGDGSSLSASTSPTHTYAQVGQYTVVLTATNPYGEDVCSHDVSIEGAPVPSFTSNSPVVAGNPVVFTNTTLANPSVIAWLWNLGDGTSSTAQTPPAHTYAVGTYTVTLTAVNVMGTNVYTGTVTVAPIALFLPLVRR
jgi:PKD repeat protein